MMSDKKFKYERSGIFGKCEYCGQWVKEMAYDVQVHNNEECPVKTEKKNSHNVIVRVF